MRAPSSTEAAGAGQARSSRRVWVIVAVFALLNAAGIWWARESLRPRPTPFRVVHVYPDRESTLTRPVISVSFSLPVVPELPPAQPAPLAAGPQGERLQGDRLQGDRLQGDRLQGDRLQGDRPQDPGAGAATQPPPTAEPSPQAARPQPSAPEPAAELCIRLEPPVSGRALWAGPSTLLFYPAVDLQRGREYQVVISPGLRAASAPGAGPGAPLEGPTRFAFGTEPIKILGVDQVGFTKQRQGRIRLRFNDRVLPSDVSPHLVLRGSDDREIPYTVVGTTSSNVPQSPLAPQVVDGQASMRQTPEVLVDFTTESPTLLVTVGPAPRRDVMAGPTPPPPPKPRLRLASELQVPMVLTREFRVTEVRPEQVFQGTPSLWIGFNQSIISEQTLQEGGARRTASLSEFFSLEPRVAFGVSNHGSSITLLGDFRPGARYTLTVRKGLEGTGGAVLPADHVDQIVFPTRRAGVTFQEEGVRLSSRGNLTVLLDVSNSERLTVRARRVLENNLVHFLKIRYRDSHFMRDLPSRTFELPSRPDEVQQVAIDLRDLVGPDSAGVWQLEAFVPSDSDSRLVVVSDLALTAKLSPRSTPSADRYGRDVPSFDAIVAWVTSVRTADPVAGARVSLWTSTNQRVAEAITDSSGLARFDGPLDPRDGPPEIITATLDGDLAYLEIEESELSRADFDVSGKAYLREGHEAFVFTERGVYRPGETVHVRALVVSAEALGRSPPPRGRAPEFGALPDGRWSGLAFASRPAEAPGPDAAGALAAASPDGMLELSRWLEGDLGKIPPRGAAAGSIAPTGPGSVSVPGTVSEGPAPAETSSAGPGAGTAAGPADAALAPASTAAVSVAPADTVTENPPSSAAAPEVGGSAQAGTAPAAISTELVAIAPAPAIARGGEAPVAAPGSPSADASTGPVADAAEDPAGAPVDPPGPGELARWPDDLLLAAEGDSDAAGLGPLPLEVEIVRPDGRRYRLDRCTLNPSGALDLEIPLSPTAATGRYQVRVRLPGVASSDSDGEDGEDRDATEPKGGTGLKIGATSFRVEEYMPNRIRASVALAGEAGSEGEAAARRFRPGDRVDLVVRAKYLFGLPAEGCAVSTSWSLESVGFSPTAWREFRFGPLSASRVSVARGSDSVVLDETGTAETPVLLPQAETGSALELRFSADVSDVGGRTVTVETRVPVDPAPHYLGLRKEGPEPIRAGQAARFQCVSVDPLGKPADLDAAELVAHRVRRSWIYRKDEDGRYRYERNEEVQEIARRRIAFSGGLGSFELTFDETGDYRLRLKDPGSAAVGEIEVYATGTRDGGWIASSSSPSSSPSPDGSVRPERVEIVHSGVRVAPGGRTRVLVNAPFAGTLLVTTETDRVSWSKVVRMDGPSAEVFVPVPECWADGNFYVGASVVRPVDPEAEWMPHRAWGLVSVPVDLSERRVGLTLSVSPELRPGARESVRVVAAAADGSPVEGVELVVAAVDTGILELTGFRTPDPLEWLLSKRAHGIELSDTYGDLLEEIPLARTRSRPGGDSSGYDGSDGGDGGRQLSPVVSRRVKSAVRWLGPATTGPDGGAVLELDVPRFTGELRVYAVACERSRRFGTAEQTVLVRSPFFFEVGLPRFLAPGDRILAPVRAFNRTGRDGAASLAWTLDGLREGGAPAEAGLALAALRGAPVEIAADGSKELVYALEADERVGTATVRLEGSITPPSHAAGGSPAGGGGGESGGTPPGSEAPAPDASPDVTPAIARPDGPAPGTTAPAETHVEEIEIPVRPASTIVTRSRSGRIAQAEPLEIHPEGGMAAGTSRYRLVLSAFPEVELAGSLRYLIHYPYGCLEQTTSSVFALLYVRDLLDRLGIDALADERGRPVPEEPPYSLETRRERLSREVDDFVNAGISRILDMQSHVGWCSTWPNGGEPWRWGSVYAAHFLLEAKGAGYPVPRIELDALLRYIRDQVVPEREGGAEAARLERAYGLYVLALSGKPEVALMDNLRESSLLAATEAMRAAARAQPATPAPAVSSGASQVVTTAVPVPAPRSSVVATGATPAQAFDPATRFLLAGAYLSAGRPDRARELIGDDLPDPLDVRDSGGALRSPARDTAILLSTVLDADPASPLVQPLVDRLRSYRINCHWGTTQENAFAVLALGKYARKLASGPLEAVAELRLGDAPPTEIRTGDEAKPSRTLEWSESPGAVRVAISGAGTLFYSWTEEGVPERAVTETIDSGMRVRRRYLDPEGKPIDPLAIRSGDTVLVEISIETDRYLENVAVVDLLPAGLEVENPNLRGKGRALDRLLEAAKSQVEASREVYLLDPEHTSHRDDRVVSFVSLSGGRRGILHHVCRAVTRGEFALPPVRAEALYDPRVQSVSGGGRMAIR